MAVNDGNARGADLERRVGRIEFADGSLVRLRWPVTHQLSGRRRIVTDVDVLAVDFDDRLRPVVSIIECKSTRGQAGEQDRLLWLSGLQSFLRAERAVLARESVSAAGRDIARNLDIELLATRELKRREAQNTWMPESFGLIGDGPGILPTQQAADQLKLIGDFPAGLSAFLKYDAHLAEPHKVLGAIATLADISKTGTLLPEPLGTILASDALLAIIMAGLRAGGRLDFLGYDGVKREIEDGLATGDPHDRQVFKVIELADALLREQLSMVHQTYVESGARPVDIKYASLRDVVSAPPVWLGRFMDFAERCRDRTAISRNLPQTADLVLYDALPGGNAWSAPAFDHLFTVEHRQLIIIALEVLRAAAPALYDRLDQIRALRFDRTALVAPDRQTPPTAEKLYKVRGTVDFPRRDRRKEDVQDERPAQEGLTFG